MNQENTNTAWSDLFVLRSNSFQKSRYNEGLFFLTSYVVLDYDFE